LDKSISTAENLARIGRATQLAELEYEDAEVKIHLTFEEPRQEVSTSFDPALFAAHLSSSTQTVAPAPLVSAGSPSEASGPSTQGETIVSPLAGIFYRSPNPEADPFVNESDQISEGQTLCIVEAMKLMNEITAERACKVAKILVENAEAVEEGQPLFIIE
jgi:acetyl-CoA carboxylase biotin carboxyl carrier protein